MPFQSSVNTFNPPAVAGDFASANPRASVLAGEGALVAGPNGVTVGRFCWIAADGTVTNTNPGTGAPVGFCGRRQGSALITTYLGEASNIIPAGFPITLHNEGDFWATVNGAAATPGAAVYAANADGSVYVGAAPAAGGVAVPTFNFQSAAAVGEVAKISTWGN